MSQSTSEPDKQSDNPQPKISQNSSGNLGGGQQAIYGDNNFQNQDNITFNIYLNEDFFELPEHLTFKSWKHKFCNYIKTIIFLLLVLLSWGFLGIFANHAFPPSLVKDILKYSFAGVWSQSKSASEIFEETSANLWKNTKHIMLSSLPDIEETNDKIEAKKLNRRDSYYWLIANLAEILQEDSDQSEEIFWNIRKLEEKRLNINPRLEHLKQKHLKELKFVQESISKLTLLSKKSQKYDQVEKILNELVRKYVMRKNVSELEIQDLIEDLGTKITKTPMTQSLYNVWKLLNWIYTQVHESKNHESYTALDSSYPLIRALKTKQRKYHIRKDCGRYPKIETIEDVKLLDFYDTEEDAKKDRYICDLCKNKEFAEFLQAKTSSKSSNIKGLWTNADIDLTEEELATTRKEMWANFPKDIEL